MCLHPRQRGWAAGPGGGVCSQASRKPRRERARGGAGGGGHREEEDGRWGVGRMGSWPSNLTVLTSAPSIQELSGLGAKHKGV